MVFATGRDGSCLFSALGHTVTHNTVGRLCTELSSAQVTTLSMSVKCCSPWRGQKVGAWPLLLAWSVVLWSAVSSGNVCSVRTACLPVGGSPLGVALSLQAQEGNPQACSMSLGHTHTPPQPNETWNRSPFASRRLCEHCCSGRVCTTNTHGEYGETGLWSHDHVGPKP